MEATKYVPARVCLAVLCSTGIMTIYMSRVNLSVAIVAMTSRSQARSSINGTAAPDLFADNSTIISDKDDSKHTVFIPYCLRNNGNAKLDVNNEHDSNSTDVHSDKITEEDEEDVIYLTGSQKGLVLGAFFYGYVLTSILGGRLAELYGTKRVFAVGSLVAAVLSILTPLAARVDYRSLITLRVMLGMGQGLCYPSLHALQVKWIPTHERSRFMSFVYLSNCLGIIVTLPISGIIIDSVGWPWVFYVTGIVSFVWLVIWWWLMYDYPGDHPRISIKELHFIRDNINANIHGRPESIPWCSIAKSVPMWAISLAHSGNMFGLSFLITQLPNYMSSILGFSIKANASLSSLPFLTRFIGSNVTSWIADWINKNKKLKLINTRRLFVFIGLVIPGAVMVIISYIGCSPAMVVVLFAVATFCNGSTIAGYGSNHIDLAYNFGGTLLGVSNTLAFLFATAAPVVVGTITVEETLSEWQTVFWITFAIYSTSFVSYFFLCSTNTQPWNNVNFEEHCEDEEEMKDLKTAN